VGGQAGDDAVNLIQAPHHAPALAGWSMTPTAWAAAMLVITLERQRRANNATTTSANPP
jgi:hypothetical protein